MNCHVLIGIDVAPLDVYSELCDLTAALRLLESGTDRHSDFEECQGAVSCIEVMAMLDHIASKQ